MAKKKHRSPSYPAVDLRTAIRLAQKIYPAAKHALGTDVIAGEWQYKSGSTASPYIAALKYYGLLKEEDGGQDRMLCFTDLALDILVDPDGKTVQREKAIKAAATKPSLYAELWNKWGAELPLDAEIRRYLERDRNFNPKYVEKVVANYKATVTFAELRKSDTIMGEGGNTEDSANTSIQAGAYVQWNSHGVDQFPVPQRVVAINGDYAFVESSPTGVPMSQLAASDPPSESVAEVITTTGPPANPYYKPPAPETSGASRTSEGTRIQFPLSGGNSLEISLQRKVSPSDFDRIKALVDLSRDSLVDDKIAD